MEGRWRIELFGGLRVRGEGQVISRFATQKTAGLLAYLACGLHRAHPRDALIDLFWPDLTPPSARNSLSKALSSLRHLLEPSGVPAGTVLVASHAVVQLDPTAVTTDVAEFEAALQAAARSPDSAERMQRLIDAVDLCRGELLSGYYEPWVLEQREWLSESYFRALHELLALLETAGEPDRALQYARQGVRADPLREEAHRDLMRLLAAVGEPATALRQYRELERILEQELGATPAGATRALARQLAVLAEPAGTGGSVHHGDTETRSGSDPLSPCLRVPSEAGVEQLPSVPRLILEPIGGAVPLESAFYVVRPPDPEFQAAIARRDSIVLVKGAREIGKTSLLARGLHQAREAGAALLLTDFQKLNASHLASPEALFLTLAQWIAVQLDLDVLPHESWDAGCGPNINFEFYVKRHVLGKVAGPIVWALDDVDRLFTSDFGSDFFGLLRSWHNARSFQPAGPWSRLTLVISYATEAHLFLTDPNQSPFNVGTRLTLEDFSVEQVGDLNRRYGSPLKDEREIARFYRLLSGHPYLVRRGLHEMAAHGIDLDAIERQVDRDGEIFGGHLRRMLASLTRDPELTEVVRGVLQGRPCPTAESFYRLRSAGVMVGDSARDVRPRCQLYATYLEQRLR